MRKYEERGLAMNQDSEHLKLLSIFHYVTAGLAALFSCIPFLHFWLGIMMVTGQLEPSDPALEIFGWFFVVFAGGLSPAASRVSA